MKWQTYTTRIFKNNWSDSTESQTRWTRQSEKWKKKRNAKRKQRTTIQLMFWHSHSAACASVTDRHKLIDKLQFPRYAWITNTHLLYSISIPYTQTNECLWRFVVFVLLFFFIVFSVLFLFCYNSCVHIRFLPFFLLHCLQRTPT